MRITPVNLYSFKSNQKANYSKENNVAILGSSKASPNYLVLDAMDKTSQVTKNIILSGKNILTGCGSKGIMGSAYYTAAQYSTKDENGIPEQNVVILKEPFWGDEDLENCKILGSSSSEATRIEKFIETADSFVIFPGGPGTMQEAVTIISNNYYNQNDKKKVVLVGKEYFQGLNEQYWTMYRAGLISVKPYELYTLVDEVNETLREIQRTNA